MRILLTGSSGFIGSVVHRSIADQGHEVVALKRGSGQKKEVIFWNPSDIRNVHVSDFESFDAVINLAGEPIVGRWTARKKRDIFMSRAAATLSLTTILAGLAHPPKIFLSASAIGYYGDRGEECLRDGDPVGIGFLPHVCLEWEKALKPLQGMGTRTVLMRFGTVIGKNGGLLQKMMRLFRVGLGGILGSGQQWVSWIALDDLVQGILFALSCQSLEGAVNFVAPMPIRQEQLARELGKFLHRPVWLRQPAWLLRLVLGEMADGLLLCSTRAVPGKLTDLGFDFQYPDLQSALRHALNNRENHG